MDLDYLVSRHQKSLVRAGLAPCVASRASHRAFAAGYAERIRQLKLSRGTAGPAIAA